MGIRLALGAPRTHLLRMSLGEAWIILNVGSVLGIFGSFTASRAISSLLVDIGQHDPAVNLGALVVMTLVSLSAAILPATHAARADLLTVLREE